MARPDEWTTGRGEHERALEAWIASREVPESELIAAHSVEEIERLQSMIDPMAPEITEQQLGNYVLMETILAQLRQYCFIHLCIWERQLAYAGVAERIFDRFRGAVDAQLAMKSPETLQRFTAVFNRLREVGAIGGHPSAEELAQALTSCRRILKAVADLVYPAAQGGASEEGHALDDSKYRNRIRQFLADHGSKAGSREAAVAAAEVEGLFARFEALDHLASKGLHEQVSLEAAEMCAIGTYLVAGALIRIHDAAGGQGVAGPDGR